MDTQRFDYRLDNAPPETVTPQVEVESGDGLLTIAEAAALSGVTESAVSKWGSAGQVKKAHVDGHVLYVRSSLMEHLQTRKLTKGGHANGWVGAKRPKGKGSSGHTRTKRTAQVVIERDLVTITELMDEIRRELLRFEVETHAAVVKQLKGELTKALL